MRIRGNSDKVLRNAENVMHKTCKQRESFMENGKKKQRLHIIKKTNIGEYIMRSDGSEDLTHTGH